MDFKASLPYDEEYGQQLKAEENILKIARLTLDLHEANPPTYPEKKVAEGRKQTFLDLEKFYDAAVVDLDKKKTAYAESTILKTHRKDVLDIPADTKVHSTQFNLKDAITILGKVNEETSGNIRSFFDSMFDYGKNIKLSYADYKNILATCFEGKLKQQFLAQKDDDLKVIVEWFDTVYHRPDEFHVLDKQLKSFMREGNEAIHIFITRYKHTAKRADALLPSDQKFFTTNMHLQNVIEMALQGQARIDYKKWKNRYFDGGFTISLEECIRQAGLLERFHSCIPEKPVPLYQNVDPTSAYGTYNTNVDIQVNALTRAGQKQAQQPMLTLNDLPKPAKRNVKKVTARNGIDPNRSSAQAPSFFNNRDSYSQMQRNRVGRAPTLPTVVKRPLPSLRQQTVSLPMKGRMVRQPQLARTPLTSRQFGKGVSPPTPRPQGRPRFPINGNRRTSLPQRFVRGSYPRLAPNIPPLVHQRQDRQPRYCLRCGVRKGANRSQIFSSHHTKDCYLYPRCDTLCPYCLQVNGIEAYHYATACRERWRDRSNRKVDGQQQ